MNYLRRILAKLPNDVAQPRRYCISEPAANNEPAIQDRELVKLERQGSVFIISLNRPHKRNAINKEMVSALREAFHTFETDESAKIGVLYGIGGSFSSGYDMKEFFEDSVNPASLFPTVS